MTALTGGDKLKAELKRIAAQVQQPASLEVGFLDGATYPGTGVSVAMVAAIQNFGAPARGIPARPFFTGMIETHQSEWGPQLGDTLNATGFDVGRSLELVGETIEGELKESIIDLQEPALSPITVMLRGMRSNDQNLIVSGRTVGEAAARVKAGKTNYGASTKPLVDSGFMLDSTGKKVTVG